MGIKPQQVDAREIWQCMPFNNEISADIEDPARSQRWQMVYGMMRIHADNLMKELKTYQESQAFRKKVFTALAVGAAFLVLFVINFLRQKR